MKFLLPILCMLIVLEAKEVSFKQVSVMNESQVINKIKKQGVTFINIKENYPFEHGFVKARTVVNINQGLLEFRPPELFFKNYKKDESFIVFSKEESHSIVFVRKLITMGFTNVHYLKNGYKAWYEILRKFRGIKVFSMFFR